MWLEHLWWFEVCPITPTRLKLSLVLMLMLNRLKISYGIIIILRHAYLVGAHCRCTLYTHLTLSNWPQAVVSWIFLVGFVVGHGCQAMNRIESRTTAIMAELVVWNCTDHVVILFPNLR